MKPSEKLIAFHDRECPNIKIDSIAFTEFLLAKFSKLKAKTKA